MELKEYLKILQKHLRLIIFTTILVAFVSYIFTIRQTSIYEADVSLTIVPKPAPELKNVYEYSDYYALQAAALFSNTVVVGWLQSPDIILEIYKKAGYEPVTENSKALSKLIKATTIPNSFALRFQLKDRSKEKALGLAQSAIKVIKEKVSEFNQKAGAKSNFEITSNNPAVIEVRPNKEFYILIGLLLGLVLGIFIAFTKEYFKRP